MKNLCKQSLAWLLLVSLLLESCHNLIDQEAPISQDSCQGDNLVPPLSVRATNQTNEITNELASNSQANNLLALQAHENKEELRPDIAIVLARHGEIFSTFPKEIWQHILSYISAEHIGKIRQANRAFYCLTTGYNQPGLVGVDNKPTHHIKVDSWMIKRQMNFKKEERFKRLTPYTVPSLLFYQFLEKAKDLPQSFWPYLADTHIKEIDLANEYIGDWGVAELAKYLQGTNVCVVGLMSNKISDSGVQALANALPNTKIHTLDLAGTRIGASGAQLLAMELFNTQIHTLNLGGNQIGASGAQWLAAELSKTQIHTLALLGNQIGASGAESLAAELSKTQIHTLSLSDNQIGVSGAQLLANALPNSQIHTLHLSRNQIGDLGARALAAALSKTQIHTLILSDNCIGNSGARALAKELSKTQIHTLILYDNSIGDSIQKLLKAQYPNIKWKF